MNKTSKDLQSQLRNVGYKGKFDLKFLKKACGLNFDNVQYGFIDKEMSEYGEIPTQEKVWYCNYSGRSGGIEEDDFGGPDRYFVSSPSYESGTESSTEKGAVMKLIMKIREDLVGIENLREHILEFGGVSKQDRLRDDIKFLKFFPNDALCKERIGHFKWLISYYDKKRNNKIRNWKRTRMERK